MNWRKNYFRSIMSLKLPMNTKKKLLNNLFKDKNVYIFAAGPSLNHVDIEKMEDLLKENLVICIKQSYNTLSTYSDLLLMNFCNFQDYKWNSLKCPVIWATFEDNHSKLIKEQGIRCDEIIKIIDNKKGFSYTTAFTNLWSDILDVENMTSRWGPGLMYELALPISLFTGVDTIYLVGWDIGTLDNDNNKSFMNKHFYDHSKVKMKTKINNKEIELVSESTKDLKEWLEKEGKAIKVISDISLVHKSINRENKWLKK